MLEWGQRIAPLPPLSLVGASGFEPPTSATRTLRSTRLSHAPRCVAAMRLVPKVGVEPTWSRLQRFLRPSRLPFRHFGVTSGIIAERADKVKPGLSDQH